MDSQADIVERLKQSRDKKREELYKKSPQYAFEQWFRENCNSLPFDGGETLQKKAAELGITADETLKLSDKVLEARRNQFESWFREHLKSRPSHDDETVRATARAIGVDEDEALSITTEVLEANVCQFTGAEEEFRKRLKHVTDDGWLFDVNAAAVGLTLEQAIAVTRRWSTVTGTRAVARARGSDIALFFDPEDDFYKSLEHTCEYGWDFDFQREMMGVTQEEATVALNRWLKEQGYSV
jgi:hypothetical protein